MSSYTLFLWFGAALAVGGTLAAMVGGRTAITLPAAAIALPAFVFLSGSALAEGSFFDAAVLASGALADAALIGSALRYRARPPRPSDFPIITRFRDLSGRSISVERLDATAVLRRGLGEVPDTLAIVERRDGKFVRIVETTASVPQASRRAAEIAVALVHGGDSPTVVTR